MAEQNGGKDWLYHLPAFLDQVRESGAHAVRDGLEVDIGGFLYHHRGARVPAHNATFVWRPDESTFELELDALGRRAAWAIFDADREWDFFLSQPPEDNPFLAWMCDDEFRTEEADDFESKVETVGLGRFSFGLFLVPPPDWEELEKRARETDVPCFVQRPSGRMLVPEEGLEQYESVLPSELLDGTPPDHLGLVDAHIDHSSPL